jgi:uncharacterized BrkB/YihY/UPF0761 family membrane protein
MSGPVFWRNRLTQISLGLAIVLNLLLFILVLTTNQQLQEAIAGGISGSANRFGAPSDALILPVIGLVSWIIGGALAYFYFKMRNEAPMATIILGAVILIELATWVPVLSLLIVL